MQSTTSIESRSLHANNHYPMSCFAILVSVLTVPVSIPDEERKLT